MGKYLVCRFCEWSTVKIFRTKAGRLSSGYRSLDDHVAMEHPEEYKKITDETEKHRIFCGDDE